MDSLETHTGRLIDLLKPKPTEGRIVAKIYKNQNSEVLVHTVLTPVSVIIDNVKFRFGMCADYRLWDIRSGTLVCVIDDTLFFRDYNLRHVCDLAYRRELNKHRVTPRRAKIILASLPSRNSLSGE